MKYWRKIKIKIIIIKAGPNWKFDTANCALTVGIVEEPKMVFYDILLTWFVLKPSVGRGISFQKKFCTCRSELDDHNFLWASAKLRNSVNSNHPLGIVRFQDFMMLFDRGEKITSKKISGGQPANKLVSRCKRVIILVLLTNVLRLNC